MEELCKQGIKKHLAEAIQTNSQLKEKVRIECIFKHIKIKQ